MVRRCPVAFVGVLLCALGPLDAQAQGQGKAAKPWIGIAIEQGTRGVRVREVFEGTPAAKAGLRPGDEVLSVGGIAVKEPGELIGKVQAMGIGAKATLGVLRDKGEAQLTLVLEPRPDQLKLLQDRLVGKPAPPFALATVSGQTTKLEGLKGKVVLLEFWETWCGACRASMPRIDAWHKAYGGKGLAVVGVSPEPMPALAGFAAAEKLVHTIAHDPNGDVNGRYGVPAIPTFVVIDRAGIVRHVDVGAGENLNAVEAMVKSLL